MEELNGDLFTMRILIHRYITLKEVSLLAYDKFAIAWLQIIKPCQQTGIPLSQPPIFKVV